MQFIFGGLILVASLTIPADPMARAIGFAGAAVQLIWGIRNYMSWRKKSKIRSNYLKVKLVAR